MDPEIETLEVAEQSVLVIAMSRTADALKRGEL